MTRILVVNRAGKRSFMPDILEDFSSEIDIYSVDDVLDSTRWESISLIVVDVGRTAISNALDLVLFLRRHQSFLSVPIVVCAPADDYLSIQQDRLLENGIFILVKPFELDDLRQYVDVLLDPHFDGLPAVASAVASPPHTPPRLMPKRVRG